MARSLDTGNTHIHYYYKASHAPPHRLPYDQLRSKEEKKNSWIQRKALCRDQKTRRSLTDTWASRTWSVRSTHTHTPHPHTLLFDGFSPCELLRQPRQHMKSDVRTTRSKTNVRLRRISGSVSARPLCCFSFPPSSLWSLPPVQHGRGLVVQIPGREME